MEKKLEQPRHFRKTLDMAHKQAWHIAIETQEVKVNPYHELLANIYPSQC